MIDNPLLFGRTPFCSMPVYEEPLPSPKIQLSEHVQVTDEFRREMNNWLLIRFGRKKRILDSNKFFVSEKYGFIVAPPGMAGLLYNICG